MFTIAWVITRPPASIRPEHNGVPTEPRRDTHTTHHTADDDQDEYDAEAASSHKGFRAPLFKRRAGRRWDHLRSAEPVIVSQFRAPLEAQSPWHEFVASSRYPHVPNEESEIVSEEDMAKFQPSFGYPVHVPLAATSFENKKQAKARTLWQRIWQMPLRHPLGPLACRLTVLSTSIVALALAARISRLEAIKGDSPAAEKSQIIVAIVVDIVAIPYIGYITVDDYTGKPLGLRPPKARIRLILLDLFFIIFKSASTALGFEAMLFFHSFDTQPYLRALGAFELVGLISWAMTLTINVFREIERLGG